MVVMVRWPWCVVLLLAGACTQSSVERPETSVRPVKLDVPHMDSAPAQPLALEITSRVDQLSLRRTGCYGTCAVFSATIRRDGSVWYYGERWVDREGLSTGVADHDDIARLFAQVVDSGFVDLAPLYERRRTDQATTHTAATVDGRRKYVRDYGRAAPPSHQALLTAFDAVVVNVQWDGQPRTLAHDPGVCQQLADAIADLCEPRFELRLGAEACDEFARLAQSLGRNDSPVRRQRCAHQLANIPRVGALSEKPKFSRNCKAWHAKHPTDCLDSLRANGLDGELHGCTSALVGVYGASGVATPDFEPASVCNPLGRL